MTSTSSPLLEIRSMTVRFGGLLAISELDLEIQPPNFRLGRAEWGGKNNRAQLYQRLCQTCCWQHHLCRNAPAPARTASPRRTGYRAYFPAVATVHDNDRA